MGDGRLVGDGSGGDSRSGLQYNFSVSNVFVTIRGNNKHTYRLRGAMPPSPSSLSSSLLPLVLLPLLLAVIRGGRRGGGWCCDAATPPRRGCGFHCRCRRRRRRGCWWAMGDG